MWKRVKNKDKVSLLFPRVAADIVLLPKVSAVSAAVFRRAIPHSAPGAAGTSLALSCGARILFAHILRLMPYGSHGGQRPEWTRLVPSETGLRLGCII